MPRSSAGPTLQRRLVVGLAVVVAAVATVGLYVSMGGQQASSTDSVGFRPSLPALRTVPVSSSARAKVAQDYIDEMRAALPSPCLKLDLEQLKRKARGARVLVTGAAGFIGSHVAEYAAVTMGMDVVAVDDLSGGFMSNVPDGVTFVQGDVSDADFVRDLFRDHGPFKFVYHLAAYAAEGLSHFIRPFNYRNNLVGSVELLDHAVNGGTEVFVFTSSIAVYGAGQVPMVETMRPSPEDPYGISKFAMEMDLKAAHEMWGTKFVVMRPHNVYGPRQNVHDKYRNVLGIFMAQILRGEPMTIFGDGKQTRAFTYIDDVAIPLVISPLVPQAHNQVFNVGSDTAYSLNKLARLTADAMGVEHNVRHLDARNEVLHAASTHEKLRCYFSGLAEPMVLSDGLNLMAKWVRDTGKDFTPYEFVHDVQVTKSMPPSWMRPPRPLVESAKKANVLVAISTCCKGGKWVDRLLKSLAATGDSIDVRLYDDLSSDNTKHVAMEYIEEAQIVRHSHATGLTYGWNEAMRYFAEHKERYEMTCVLNNDVMVPPGVFATMLEGVRSLPEELRKKSMVGPMASAKSLGPCSSKVCAHQAVDKVYEDTFGSDGPQKALLEKPEGAAGAMKWLKANVPADKRMVDARDFVLGFFFCFHRDVATNKDIWFDSWHFFNPVNINFGQEGDILRKKGKLMLDHHAFAWHNKASTMRVRTKPNHLDTVRGGA